MGSDQYYLCLYKHIYILKIFIIYLFTNYIASHNSLSFNIKQAKNTHYNLNFISSF